MPTRKKQHISVEDLYKFKLITDCKISPDGQHIVFCVQRVDRKSEKKYSNLWIVPAEGGRALQFTHGNQVDSQPKWSPDGKYIAFISNRDDEKQSQIYIIPFHGGEARKLTNLKGTISIFEWSPESKRIVCQFRKKDKDEIEREKDEQKKNLGIVSRHIKRIFYKLDATGTLPKERWHIWTIDIRTGKAKQLTKSDIYDDLEPHWSHDGKEIVFCSNHSKDPDLDPDAIDLFMISADGGELSKIKTPIGPKDKPTFSPDGKWIAYFGQEGKGKWWKNTYLWIVPVDSSKKAKNLTEKFDFDVSSTTINDMPGLLPLMPPIWSYNGNKIYFQVSQHGNTTLKSIALSGRKQSLQTVAGGKGVVGFL